MDNYRGAGLRGFFRQSPVVLVQFVKVTLFFIKGGEDGSIGNLRVSEKMYFTGEEYAEKYRGIWKVMNTTVVWCWLVIQMVKAYPGSDLKGAVERLESLSGPGPDLQCSKAIGAYAVQLL